MDQTTREARIKELYLVGTEGRLRYSRERILLLEAAILRAIASLEQDPKEPAELERICESLQQAVGRSSDPTKCRHIHPDVVNGKLFCLDCDTGKPSD